MLMEERQGEFGEVEVSKRLSLAQYRTNENIYLLHELPPERVSKPHDLRKVLLRL